MSRDNEGHYIMMKESILQEDKVTVAECMEQTKKKGDGISQPSKCIKIRLIILVLEECIAIGILVHWWWVYKVIQSLVEDERLEVT